MLRAAFLHDQFQDSLCTRAHSLCFICDVNESIRAVNPSEANMGVITDELFDDRDAWRWSVEVEFRCAAASICVSLLMRACVHW